MKASEALELSKKIKRSSTPDGEFAEKDGQYLRWHEGCIVGFDGQTANDWEPICGNIIKPETNEVWEDASGTKWVIFGAKTGILFKQAYGETQTVSDKMAHGYYGWTRLLPFVDNNKFDVGIVHPHRITSQGRLSYTISVPDGIINAVSKHKRVRMILEVLK